LGSCEWKKRIGTIGAILPFFLGDRIHRDLVLHGRADVAAGAHVVGLVVAAGNERERRGSEKAVC
jgi:hypothetical protein